ncbi:hypothetical protein JOC93_000567 [Priestia taiwanensis]|nr:hypothetical protein [Priestia taiwanensis]
MTFKEAVISFVPLMTSALILIVVLAIHVVTKTILDICKSKRKSAILQKKNS